jgi:hypothetical protein
MLANEDVKARTYPRDKATIVTAPVVGKAIVDFHLKNPLEGYRRLTFMMLDQDVVAVSPSSVWRVLGQAGLLAKWNGEPSKKGTGFAQPPAAHKHRSFWHGTSRNSSGLPA